MATVGELRIRYLSATNWAQECAELLVSVIAQHIQNSGRCSVMLTGGRSAAALYNAWGNHTGFRNARGVDYYFGDERCVLSEDAESNFGMAMRILFKEGVPQGCALHRMEGENLDVVGAADRYSASLPLRIDVLLLSIGEDGHIASLFPHSSALHEQHKKVAPTIGSKWPYARLTITPSVIQNAKEVFVLCIGSAKQQLLDKLLLDPSDYTTMPARLAISGEWITVDICEHKLI